MPSKTRPGFFEALATSAMIVGVMYVVMAVGIVFRLPLQEHGIVPRTQYGLPGIIWSPFLHANMDHLLANSIPLFILLVLLFSSPEYRPYRTLILIWVASGLGTWAIGRGGAVHIGASSVVFGLASFLIVAGFYLRNWRSALVGILVFLVYGGIFYGALPHAGPISWEGHLCGSIAGVLTARGLKG